MTVKAATFNQFYGGQSQDKKIGPKASFAYSQAFDFRKNPSQLSVLPRLQQEDNGVCKDLILKEVMVNDGTIYATGSDGYFYRRSTAGVWSVEANLGVGSAGLDYRRDANSLYIPGDRSVSLYDKVDTSSPVMIPNHYGPSYSTYNNSDNMGFNVAAYQAGSSSTTALATSITEDVTALRYFQTDIEPLVKVSVFIVAKGTGDWTVTLHDGLNNVLGTKTITNANLKNNQFNDFAFTAATNQQVRVYPAPNARTYHIHVTSTVADGTISSSTKNSMDTCDLEVWADRMVVTNNGLHPMIRFQQFECIGNGNYLSTWEPISDPPTNDEWKRHALTFPQEYEVCGLAVQNEFIVIAAERATTATTTTPQQGILFFWDGLSNTYNYFIEVPEGSPYGLQTYNNVAYYIAGGDWYAVTSATTQPVKVRSMPGSDNEFSGITSNAPTTGASGNYLTQTLTDNFSGPGSAPNPDLWDSFGNTALSNGTLVLTTDLAASTGGMTSDNLDYDLTGSFMQIKVVSAGNQALTSFEVYPVVVNKDASNKLFWYINGGTIYAFKRVAGSNTSLASTTYSSTTHVYLRIREAAGTIYFDYSANGVDWTNFTSLGAPFDVTAITQEISMDTYAVEASTTSCVFDEFNLPVSSDLAVGYPEAMTVRRGILLTAYPAQTANQGTPYGVYSWGAVDKNFNNSFGYSYVLSTGDQYLTDTNNLQLGMVKAFGDLLHVSWRDDKTPGTPRYGVDVITNASPPAATAVYQTPIVDNRYPAKYKTGLYIEAYYDLPAGATIQLGYSIDRGNFVTDSATYSSTNLWQGRAGYARFNITDSNGGRFHELQGQVTVTCASNMSTTPIVYMVSLVYDSNDREALQ